MRTIDNIDLQRRSTNRKQVAMIDDGAGLFRSRLPIRINLLAVKVGAVFTSQIPDFNARGIDVQLTMVPRNELISLRSGKLDEAIQSPSHLTACRPAKAKPAVLMRPGEHGKPDGGNHRQISPISYLHFELIVIAPGLRLYSFLETGLPDLNPALLDRLNLWDRHKASAIPNRVRSRHFCRSECNRIRVNDLWSKGERLDGVA
jgi:hypothetical protein